MKRLVCIAIILFSKTACAQDSLCVAFVQQTGKWHLIDAHGFFLAKDLFEHDSMFAPVCSEGMVLRERGRKYGFVDLIKAKEIPCVFDSVQHFEDGLCNVKKHGRWICIDRAGNEAKTIKKQLKKTENLMNQYHIVETNGFINCSDGKGNILLDSSNEFVAPWNDVSAFEMDRIVCLEVKKNKLCTCHKSANYYGYIDRRGRWAIDAQYQTADIFSCGLAAVSTEDGYGFIDKNGHWIIPPQYEDASSFYAIKIE